MLCKTVKAEFGEKELHLAYTVNAMFQINDLLTENEQVMDILGACSQEDFKRFCEAVSILAQCGSQIREAEKLPASATPSATELGIRLTPLEFVVIKKAAMDAVLLGYGREVKDEDEEIDLELANLEKK